MRVPVLTGFLVLVCARAQAQYAPPPHTPPQYTPPRDTAQRDQMLAELARYYESSIREEVATSLAEITIRIDSMHAEFQARMDALQGEIDRLSAQRGRTGAGGRGRNTVGSYGRRGRRPAVPPGQGGLGRREQPPRRAPCPEGHWMRNGECRPAALEGHKCVFDGDCSVYRSNFTCTAGVCTVRMCEPQRIRTRFYRLSGGTSCDNGNVLMRRPEDDDWKFRVCDTNWTRQDAKVVCKSLGFQEGVPKRGSNLGRQITGRWATLDYVCNGAETSLMACDLAGETRQYHCADHEVAAVQCFH